MGLEYINCVGGVAGGVFNCGGLDVGRGGGVVVSVERKEVDGCVEDIWKKERTFL